MAQAQSRYLAGVAAALGVAMVAGSAQAACVLSIEPSADQWLVPYNPYEDGLAQRRFDIAFVNVGESECTGRVTVDLRGEPFGLMRPGSTVRVPYALVDERSGIDLTPRAGQSARRLSGKALTLAPGERMVAPFSLVAEPPEHAAQGVYTQTAFLSVQTSDGLTVGERPVTLGLDVPAAAVVGLKGEFTRRSSAAVIDLGELVEGSKPLNAAVYVHSTAGYRLSVSSENFGRLQQPGTDWSVDYQLDLGGRALNLAAPGSVDVASNVARDDEYALAVRIGNVDGKRAGRYTDTLTLTVAATP